MIETELAQKYINLLNKELALRSELRELIDERNKIFAEWQRVREFSLPTSTEIVGILKWTS